MLIVERAICKGGLGDSSYMSIAKYACRQLAIMPDNWSGYVNALTSYMRTSEAFAGICRTLVELAGGFPGRVELDRGNHDERSH